MEPNNFADYYKTISNTELLDILEHKQDYQPIAVDAAKKELENRHLSEEEIINAKKPLLEKQLEKTKQKQKIRVIENKMKTAGDTLADTLNPIQTEAPSADKLIRIISIIFFVILVFQIASDFKMLSAMLKDIKYFDTSSFFYFFPILTLVVAIITFWMRKTIGWMLLAFFIIYSAIGIIWLLFESFSWKPSGTALDNMFARPSAIVCTIQILFWFATMYTICKPDIRQVFRINKQRAVATIFMSVLVTFFLLIVID